MLDYIKSDRYGMFGSWDSLYRAYGMSEKEFWSYCYRTVSDGRKSQTLVGDIPYADPGTDSVNQIDTVWAYGNLMA